MTPKQNHQGEGGGRPRAFQSIEDMETRVQKYLDDCKTTKDPLTLTGLCLELGIVYDTFLDYESGKYDGEDSKFSECLKWARLNVVNYAEKGLYTAKNAAGPIMHIINATRRDKEPWKNAQHQEVTGANNGPLQIQITPNQAGIV